MTNRTREERLTNKNAQGQPIAVLTVGALIDILSQFDRDQPVRLAINEDQVGDGATAYQISAHIHEWGMMQNDIWSDGCLTDATVNIPILGEGEMISHNIPDKFFVKPRSDDPKAQGNYW
jgi:hypothetical protein